MIREAASNIVNIYHLSRNEYASDKTKGIQQFFRGIPHIINQFWANARHISHHRKWCKIVLLHHNIPIEICDIMMSYLKHDKLYDVPPQIEHSIYHIPIRSKLYRMGYIDDTHMDDINGMFIKKRIPYITEPWESYYYYHPHFSIKMFIEAIIVITGYHLSRLELLIVMRYWL
jgi:hypothetical protein